MAGRPKTPIFDFAKFDELLAAAKAAPKLSDIKPPTAESVVLKLLPVVRALRKKRWGNRRIAEWLIANGVTGSAITVEDALRRVHQANGSRPQRFGARKRTTVVDESATAPVTGSAHEAASGSGATRATNTAPTPVKRQVPAPPRSAASIPAAQRDRSTTQGASRFNGRLGSAFDEEF